jgi:Holliday junction resolvase RusA-like endonuclease
MPIYMLDDMQLNVLKRVKSRLYNEAIKMTADERRDLANTMYAVLDSVERFGPIEDDRKVS